MIRKIDHKKPYGDRAIQINKCKKMMGWSRINSVPDPEFKIHFKEMLKYLRRKRG